MNKRGNIQVVLAGALIVIVLAAVGGVLLSTRGTTKRVSKGESAKEAVSKQLEALLNLKFNDAVLDLTSGTPHKSPDGEIYWTVTNVQPRLKRITVTTKVVHSETRDVASKREQELSITGFKYDDF